jgi:hypothetical protein
VTVARCRRRRRRRRRACRDDHCRRYPATTAAAPGRRDRTPARAHRLAPAVRSGRPAASTWRRRRAARRAGPQRRVARGGRRRHRASRAAAGRPAGPVLAIGFGRLGYPSDVGLPELDAALDALAHGRYIVEQHVALDVQGTPRDSSLVFNDVVLRRRRAPAAIALRIDDELFMRYSGDGVIVSPPPARPRTASRPAGPSSRRRWPPPS